MRVRTPSARAAARVAACPVAEAEVLADADLLGAEPPTSTSSMKACGDCAANAPSNGITTSSRTPSAGDQVRLRLQVVSSRGAACGATTVSGCGSKVSTVSAPRITSRCPRWTPSNSPTATCRGRRSTSGSQVDVASAAEAYDGLEDAVRARLGERHQPVGVAQPHRARGGAGTARRGPRGARLRRPRARRPAGSRAPRRAGRSGRRRRRRTARSPCGAARGSRRRRGRRRASARRFPPSTRRAARRDLPPVEQLEAVDVTSRSCTSTASPARASAYARRPPTLTAEYAGGRWRSAPVGRASGSSGARPGAISPSGSPVVDVQPSRATTS